MLVVFNTFTPRVFNASQFSGGQAACDRLVRNCIREHLAYRFFSFPRFSRHSGA